MSFVFREKFEFDEDVKFTTPDGVESSFKGRFLYVDDTRWDELANDDATILREVWLGWSGIETEQKSPIAFSAEARDRFIAASYVRRAVILTYVEARNGMKAKN